MMTKWAKAVVAPILARFGLELRRIGACEPAVVDLTANGNDPRIAAYLGDLSCQPVVEARLSDCRGLGLLGYPLRRAAHHPYVLAAGRARDAAGDGGYRAIEACLEDYFRRVVPTDAAELCGLPPEMAPLLGNQTPHAAILPWVNRSPAEQLAIRDAATRNENARYGYDVGLEGGTPFFGPVKEEKLAIESRRLRDLLRSVHQTGYDVARKHDPIVAYGLVGRDGDLRYVIRVGQHRASVLAALDTASMPVRIQQIVRSADAPFWPGVRRGIYTLDGALAVFDRLFAGEVPPFARTWQLAARP